eukprot:363901-Chlamydomonas_euryale.AAC.23
MSRGCACNRYMHFISMRATIIHYCDEQARTCEWTVRPPSASRAAAARRTTADDAAARQV